MRRSIAFLLLTLFFECAVASRGHTTPEPVLSDPTGLENPPAVLAAGEEETGTFFDATHERVSKAILRTASWIDSFFVNERVEREETDTRFRLGTNTFLEENELFRTDLQTSFRLDLPVISKRFHLLFSREADEEERLTAPERRGLPPAVAPRQRATSVAVRYSFLETLRRNASLSTGLRFRDGSPVFLLEPRYRQTFPIYNWELRIIQRFTAPLDESFEALTSFGLERPLGRRFFFRTTADGAWREGVDGYFYGLHFVLFQPLSQDRMVQYALSNAFATRPAHVLERTTMSASCRQRFWREWLFFEVSPQISFRREENYEISPGILLRLDVVFGSFKSIGLLF